IKLAERLGAVVMSDLKAGSMFPTDHPAHTVQPFNVLPKAAREILTEADLILSLDWIDLHGAMKQGKSVGKVDAKVIHATMDNHLANGMNMDYQGLPPVDVAMACEGDVATTELLAALGEGKKDPWKARPAPKAKDADGDVITLNMVATT